MRDLRASEELPVFTLYRYPLVQGFERLIEDESDPEESGEFPSHSHNGISQQLNFSLISSSEADPVPESLPAPIPTIPDEFSSPEPEPLPIQPPAPVNHTAPVETPPPITPLDSAHAFDPAPITNSFEPVIHSSPEKRLSPVTVSPVPVSPVANSRVVTPPAPEPVIEPVKTTVVPHANIEMVTQPVKSVTTPVEPRPPSPVRKAPSVQINRPITDYQSPKPFKSPDQLVNLTIICMF